MLIVLFTLGLTSPLAGLILFIGLLDLCRYFIDLGMSTIELGLEVADLFPKFADITFKQVFLVLHDFEVKFK
jgi:hypothetical protein